MFKIKHISVRIILGILCLAVLISVMLGAINLYSNLQSAQTQVYELVKLSSDSYSLALENYLDNLEEEIKTIAASGALTAKSLSVDQRQENLNAIIRARPDISSIYTIGRDGISINDGDFNFENSIGEDYSEEEFFHTAISTPGIWIDDPVYDEWTNNITLTITYNFNDGAGFDGVIGMDIHYDVLLAIIESGAIGQSGYSVLVATDGRFIAHPDSNYVLDEVNYLADGAIEPDFTKALATMVGPGNGRIENVQFGGEKVLLYYHTIPKTEWTLVTIAKPDEFMGQFYQSLTSSIIAVVACILVSVLVALVIGRMIARPITAMTKRMQMFARGDLHSPMPDVRSHDELGILRQSLSESAETLSSYVTDISDVLSHITDGDITVSVELDYHGDFAPIKRSLNDILSSLNRVLKSVSGLAEEVSGTSMNLSSVAQSLSDNTAHQVDTIEGLSQSFGEIKDGLERTATNTATALQKTSVAEKAIESSRGSMDNMLSSMDEINTAADSIERIIKTIDDIAFQTNILALNAAIEAAHAGQHGKGFAVVAEEVRGLASKSAESARQTANLIQNTLEAVSRGSKDAKSSWQEISNLEKLIGEVTSLVQQISQAADTQASSAGDIYGGIERLTDIVQADSRLAEQSAESSREMNGQAVALQDAMSFFRLSGESLPGDDPYDGQPLQLGEGQ